MSSVGVLAAFAGGLLSLLSPCAALLLPSFFAYAFGRVATLVARTGAFLAGLLVVMVPLGAGVGLVGELLTRHRTLVTTVGGVVLVVLGVLSLVGRGFGSGAAGRLAGSRRLESMGSVFLLGTVYGLAGFCSGPLLGSVLTVAAVGADPLYGAVLMGAYAVGMAAPLFVLALLWDRMGLSSKALLRGREIALGRWRVHSTNLVAGILFIGVGMLFLLTDGTASVGGLTGVDAQFSMQAWIADRLAAVPDLLVVLAAVLVLLVLAVVRMWRGSAENDPPDGNDPTAATSTTMTNSRNDAGSEIR